MKQFKRFACSGKAENHGGKALQNKAALPHGGQEAERVYQERARVGDTPQSNIPMTCCL